MTMDRDYERLLTVSFRRPMPYRWAVGRYGSRFFEEIRERGRFIGTRCPDCSKVYVPPRRVCGPCFREMTDLVPLNDRGVLRAFSVVNYPFLDPDTGRQRPIPYTYGYIQMDGADNIFSHIINETDVSKIAVGMPVRAVLRPREEMTGHMSDIRHFDIIGQ